MPQLSSWIVAVDEFDAGKFKSAADLNSYFVAGRNASFNSRHAWLAYSRPQRQVLLGPAKQRPCLGDLPRSDGHRSLLTTPPFEAAPKSQLQPDQEPRRRDERW
jgi:hypothetical protein